MCLFEFVRLGWVSLDSEPMAASEPFFRGIVVCATIHNISTVVGYADTVEELWDLARSIGYKNGDNPGIVCLAPILTKKTVDPVPWKCKVGKPLNPAIIHKINESIAQGTTHIELNSACGRDLFAQPEPHGWLGDFARPVRVSFDGGQSQLVKNTDEVWAFLREKGLTDDQNITMTVIASDDSDKLVKTAARVGWPLQARVMLLATNRAPKDVLIDVIRLDFTNETFTSVKRKRADNELAEQLLASLLGDRSKRPRGL
jgi:hypothetical protein